MGGVVGNIVGGIGGLLSGSSASGAAEAQAAAQREAALRSSQMTQFSPVGITTGFGSSNFTLDDLGRVTQAGYQLTPELQALRNQLIGGATSYSPEQLQQLINPMYGGVSSLFNLGQSYLGENRGDIAQRYIQQQQALLEPSRAAQLSGVRSRLFGTGRGGLGVQTGTGSAPASPEMQAYYNALAQQDLQLSANADRAAMEQARFGTGLLTGASELAGQIPRLYSSSFGPIQSQLGLASTVEGMGQQPFLMSQELARLQSGSNAPAANMYQTGMTNAAASQYAADSYSPLGSFLSGAGSLLGGGFGSLFSNPNQYGGLFGGGQVPTSSSGFESWNSPYIGR
jgi:hypothetical protein